MAHKPITQASWIVAGMILMVLSMAGGVNIVEADYTIPVSADYQNTFPPFEDLSTDLSENVNYTEDDELIQDDSSEVGSYISEAINTDRSEHIEIENFRASTDQNNDINLTIESSDSESFNTLVDSESFILSNNVNSEPVDLEAGEYYRIRAEVEDGATLEFVYLTGTEFYNISDYDRALKPLLLILPLFIAIIITVKSANYSTGYW